MRRQSIDEIVSRYGIQQFTGCKKKILSAQTRLGNLVHYLFDFEAPATRPGETV